MKALELLKFIYKDCTDLEDKGFAVAYSISDLNEAINELEAIKNSIKASIEEIEYALAKPNYADVYLSNALRFLKERD